MSAKYSIFILYPIALIAIKVLDKEGAAVDTVFCLTLNLVGNPSFKSRISGACFNITLNILEFSSFSYPKTKKKKKIKLELSELL